MTASIPFSIRVDGSTADIQALAGELRSRPWFGEFHFNPVQYDTGYLVSREHRPARPKDWTIEKERAAVARRAKIRQHQKENFSKSPLYQARAEKDPTFWETAWFGGVWLPEDFDADGNLMPHHLKRREEGGFPPFN